MDITFINVGYGESILITCEDPASADGQFVMLIDGGSAMDSEYEGPSGRIRALDYLKKKGIGHIDLMVFSHVHEDHTCGLLPIIREIPVKRYWTSIAIDPVHYGRQIRSAAEPGSTNRKALDSINTYSLLMDELPLQSVEWLQGILPDHFHRGDLSIDILGPEETYKKAVEASLNRCFTASTEEELDAVVTETTESINNASLILRLRCQGKAVLLCGDTNAKGFGHILRSDPELLKADVYKIGHHGQPDSVTEELVRAVDPSVIVCCASNDHRSNSSSEKTFETIRSAMGEKKVTYLFHDGLYNAHWNENTAVRNGVTVRIDESGISWELC